MSIDMKLSKFIVEKAKQCGFENCGIIPIEAIDEYYNRLNERIENVPESASFYNRLNDAFQIKERLPWAKSLVICTVWYGKYKYPEVLQGKWAKSYALGENSRSNTQGSINKLEFEKWMDINNIRFAGGEKYAPRNVFPLRLAAIEAGFGIVRKNNFFYTEKGSYYALEGYVIDKECEYRQTTSVNPCSDQCNLCQKDCPTGSLSAPYTMNPFQCISFITTFGKGIIPHDLSEDQLNEWVSGCDACQDACPYNRIHDWSKGEDFPNINYREEKLTPKSILLASDKTLEHIALSCTDHHIPKKEIQTLRINSLRSLKNKKDSDKIV